MIAASIADISAYVFDCGKRFIMLRDKPLHRRANLAETDKPDRWLPRIHNKLPFHQIFIGLLYGL
jgi:hypothetical protein